MVRLLFSNKCSLFCVKGELELGKNDKIRISIKISSMYNVYINVIKVMG